jgi:glycosyltransferase involved in cell wall biosynthesis
MSAGPADGGAAGFAVIMPVYNHAAFVGQAIESVRAQDFPSWELIVVDDGSTDGSEGIVQQQAQRDGRIRLVRQSNRGPASARNAGIRLARAPWLTFLDSDDLWFPDALTNFHQAIARNPQADFLYGFRHRLNADGSVTKLPGEFQDRPTGAAELFGRMFLSHLCVCYRRRLIERAGMYDEHLRTCEDYELYLRMSLLTGFCPLGRATGLRRRHAGNISRQTGQSRCLEAEVLRRFIEKQGGGQVVPQDLVRRRLRRLYYASAREYLKAGCHAQALEVLERSAAYGTGLKARLVKAAAALLLPLGRQAGPLPRLP